MTQRSVPKFVSDRTIDRVLKGSPFIGNENVQNISRSCDNLDKMLGFDDIVPESTNSKETEKNYGYKEETSTTQNIFDLEETSYFSSSYDSVAKSSAEANITVVESLSSNLCTANSNGTAASPELTYTPGKSRLDAVSLMRLKAKYGANRSGSVEVASSKPMRKESHSTRVALSTISTNVDVVVQEGVDLQSMRASNTSEQAVATNDEAPSRDVSASAPASRIAPSPEPEVADSKRNSRRANPVRFNENPIMGVSNTPVQIQTNFEEYSPAPTPHGQATQLAGRTPKIRYDVKLPDSEEKANNTVAAMDKQQSLGRLWTADDFGTFSVNSSPVVETKQSPVASSTRAVSYSPIENMQKSVTGDSSPTGLSSQLLLAETPEVSKQFKEMAKDLNAVVSRGPVNGDGADNVSESELNLTAEEIEENLRWQAEEDETNRLLALEESEKLRKQQDFENHCSSEEDERFGRSDELVAAERRAEEASRQRIAFEDAEQQRRVEEEVMIRQHEEAERQRRVEEEIKIQQREEAVTLQRRLEEAEREQKLLLQQVQRQQQQLKLQQEQVEKRKESSFSSDTEIIQTRSVSRSEASNTTPYVSHFAHKSKYGGVIHLTKSPTDTSLGQYNYPRAPASNADNSKAGTQLVKESPDMSSISAAWKIQSNRAVMSDSGVSPYDKIEQHHVNHQYTLDDSNATIDVSLVGRSHSFHAPRQKQQNKIAESDDEVSQVSTGDSFSATQLQLGEIDHSTITVSAFNKIPIANSSSQAKSMPVSLGSLVSAPPQRATSFVNTSLCSTTETEASMEYVGVSLSHPHPRGKRYKHENVPVNNVVPRMDTTKINSPLKMPRCGQPLSAYVASHHRKNVNALSPPPLLPAVYCARQVDDRVAPSSPVLVSSRHVDDDFIDDHDSAEDCDEKQSRETPVNPTGASRVPVDNRYLDICSEDYDDEDDDSEELFKNIHDVSTDSDNTFTIPSKTFDAKTMPEGSRTVERVSVSTQVTPGLSMLSKMKIDTFQEVGFDVSDDSSMDEEAEAKQRFPRSPYVKERLDDSEDFEFGLDELLKGSNAITAEKSTSSPSFSKTIHHLADTYSQQKNQNSSPDTLRSGPRRVVATEHSDDDSSMSSSEISGLYSEREANVPYKQEEVSSEALKATKEHAVTNMDDSALLTAATTLSLDSFDDVSELMEDEVPRLAFSRRQRKADDCSDVKEIVVRGSIGVVTTIVLPFANKREQTQNVCVKAVQMRFDNFKSNPKSGLLRSPMFTPGGANVTSSSFAVEPSNFQMKPGEDASIFVRFAPVNVGVYSGVLKIRSGNKSFMLLLRGEATMETPRKTLNGRQSVQEECTPKTVQLNRSITFEGDSMKWNDKEMEGVSDKAIDPREDESCTIISTVSAHEKGDRDVKVACDPLLMKQKWMREWLNKACDRGMAMMAAAPAITTIARHNGAFPTQVVPSEECPTSASISVIPSSLRLLPQRVERDGKHGVFLVSTGLLHGSLLIRNFSEEKVEIGVATSSPTLAVKSNRITIGAYDATSVSVEYDPLSPSTSSQGSPAASDGAHVGYVMITSSSGEEFVADIKMPPKSCLSPYNQELDPLKANDSLREYINHKKAPSEMSSYTITSKDAVVVNDDIVFSEDHTEVVDEDDKQSMMTPASPSRDSNSALHEVSSPQDQELLARKRERAQRMKERRIEEQKKEKATARGREILAKTKASRSKMITKEAADANCRLEEDSLKQSLPHYMHSIHHKGGVHEFHGVVESGGHIVDMAHGKIVPDDVAIQGSSSGGSDFDVHVTEKDQERIESEISCENEVNTPIPLTPSSKLVKRMLIDKYSPGMSDAVVGLLKISSAAATNSSCNVGDDKPSIVSMTKKSMTSPRVSLTPTKTVVSPLKTSSRKSLSRSPRRGAPVTPTRQVKTSTRKSVTKSGAATVLMKSSVKKTPGTKYACNPQRIKERDEAVTKGVFFKKIFLEFGTVKVGSLTRQKIEVCNSTSKDIVVIVKDPTLPFVTLHNEVKIRANSFVRLPIRFVPVHRGHFEMDLVGKVASTGDLIKIALVGDCF